MEGNAFSHLYTSLATLRESAIKILQILLKIVSFYGIFFSKIIKFAAKNFQNFITLQNFTHRKKG
jgi:type III secretory pathway component EscS